MRNRKDIQDEINTIGQFGNIIVIEVLLDIRDLLINIRDKGWRR